ncbi:MAG: chromosome partitioning protein ParA [Microcoleaceae cyanobacterium]
MKAGSTYVEQPVMLEKPAILSRLFLWVIMLMSGTTVIWAYFAQLDQSVPAVGQLELKNGSIELQAPNPGTVVRLHVANGDRVEKNQPLLTFSPTASSSDLESIKKVQDSIQKENQFYDDLVKGRVVPGEKPDLEAIARDRQGRLAENQVYQLLLDELYLRQGRGALPDANLQGLYTNARQEYQSKVASVDLQLSELQKQLEQAVNDEAAAREKLDTSKKQLQFDNEQLRFSQQQLRTSQDQLLFAREQLKNSFDKLTYAKDQLKNSQQQFTFSQEQLKNTQAQLQYTEEQLKLAQSQLDKSESVLQSNQEILDKITPLVEEGAMAELQQKRQIQEVLRNESEVLRQQDQIQSRAGELNNRQGDVNSRQSDINARAGDVNEKLTAIKTQEGEVNARLADISAKEGEINARRAESQNRLATIQAREGEINTVQAEVQRYQLEQEKLIVSVERVKEQLQNTKDLWAKELYNRIAENKKAIATIDSQFSKLQLENKKKLTEIDGQVKKVEETRNNQVLRAPVSGVIFDLKPSKKEESKLDMKTDQVCQYVVKSILKPTDIQPKKCEEAFFEAQQTQPLLQILGDEAGLEAKVNIDNKDIALILNALREKQKILEPYDGKELAGGEVIECKADKDCICPDLKENREKLGLTDLMCVPAEVQVDALPAAEFGTIPGEIIAISKDAIPPDPQKQQTAYTFESRIRLKRQSFVLDREKDVEFPLQNGMGVRTNINVGRRSVLELFFNRFVGKFNSLTQMK